MMRAVLISLCLGLFVCGCAPKVGDECEVNTDCGIDLRCDASQPGGYCTLSPCEVNGCPKGSVCIEFSDNSSFCMDWCESSSDCRTNYVCVDNYGDAPFCNSAPFLGN